MATFKAGPFVDELLRRTRDPQAGGTSRANVRLLLGHAARIVNAATGAVLAERDFPLEPKRTLYDLQEVNQVFLDRFVRVVGVKHEGRSLLREDWRDVTRLDRTWLRTFAQHPHTWAPVGGNLFLIYPGVSIERMYVTLVLVRLLPLFDDDDGEVLLPLELHTRLLDLAEGLIFLRRRQPADAARALARAAIVPVLRPPSKKQRQEVNILNDETLS